MSIKLSVIIPVYNSEKYIKRAIVSYLKQENFNTELIIIDDCSYDRTSMICNQLLNQHPSIKYFKLTYKKGVSYARNKGIELSKGEYILFLDADDILGDKIIDRILIDIQDSKTDILLTGYEIREKKNTFYYPQNNDFDNKKSFLQSMYKYDSNRSIRFGTIWAKIYKKKVITTLFDVSLNYAEDTIFNIYFFNNVKYIKIDSFISYIHIDCNPSSLSKQYQNNYIELLNLVFNLYCELFRSESINLDDPFILNKKRQMNILIKNYEKTNIKGDN